MKLIRFFGMPKKISHPLQEYKKNENDCKKNIKFKKKKNRRKRKSTRNISKMIRFLGVNSAGLR